MDTKGCQLVVFTIEGQRYALYLSAVERIVHVVEITPLPKAPEIVLGVINVRGQITPVVNVRKRFRLAERQVTMSDRLVLAHTPQRPVALIVDEVTGIIECLEQDIIAAKKILPDMDYVKGVVKLEDGLVLIHHLDKFLSLGEERELADALKAQQPADTAQGPGNG